MDNYYLIVSNKFLKEKLVVVEELTKEEFKKIKKRKRMARFEGKFLVKEPYGLIR